MNRSFRRALVALLVLGASYAAFQWIDVTDPKVQGLLNLFFQALGALAGVAALAFTGQGVRQQARSAPPPSAESPAGTGTGQPPAYVETEDPDRSLRTYLAQMRARVLRLGAEPMGFVEQLAASGTGGRPDPELLPHMEWLRRRDQQTFSNAVPEPIDLFDIHTRFDRAVLLGDPGSGKSTCLRQLAFAELERIAAAGLSLAELEARQERLPLYASLSDWKDPNVEATQFLRQQVAKVTGGEASYFYRRFPNLLAEGRFLLLLDGLNELPGRRVSSREGRHEQPGGKDRFKAERLIFDRREESLRDLADSTSLRSPLILTCRSHEYFDSLDWETIRLRPMTQDQIDRVLTVLRPTQAGQLRRMLDRNESLADMASNPFYLHILSTGHAGDLERLSRRGQVLESLFRALLIEEDERARKASQFRPEEPAITKSIGRIAFEMLRHGQVGDQAPLPEPDDEERQFVEALAATGLLVFREQHHYFRHQIIQEFFAAWALQHGHVRRRPATLLADKRWSEVVALWYDMDQQRVHRRLIAALRARNLPWRRPRSFPSMAQGYFGVLTGVVVFMVASAVLLDWVLWPLPLLPLPFGLGQVELVALAAGMVAIWILWSLGIRHRGVIVNSVYVLARGGEPGAVRKIVPIFNAFALVWQPQRIELAQSLAQFGKATIEPLQEGLSSRRWRVRAGCVQTLGQIARNGRAADPAIVEPLLAVVTAGDEQLTGPAIEALSYCRDPRIPDRIAEALQQMERWSPFLWGYRLYPLVRVQPGDEWSQLQQLRFSPQTLERYEELMTSDTSFVRIAVISLLGRLRVFELEERLAAIAMDRTEIDIQVRRAAAAALGLLQTREALSDLRTLAEQYPEVKEAAVAAIRSVGNRAALLALEDLASSHSWEVREAVAVVVGRLGGSDVLPLARGLATDADEDVRAATAHSLRAVDDPAAMELLTTLARDSNKLVRVAAVDSVIVRFPGHAASLFAGLAADRAYPDRIRMIRLLARYPGSDVASTLQALTNDPDRTISLEAEAARAQRGSEVAGRRDAAGRRAPLRGVAAAARSFVENTLQLEGLRTLWRDQRLSGTQTQTFNAVLGRIVSDAELARRYRVALRMFYTAMYAMFAFVGLILVLLMRLTAWAAAGLLGAWKPVVVVVVLAGVSLLLSVKVLRQHRFVGWLVWTLRWGALTILVLLAVGGLVYSWWIWVSLALLVLPVALLLLARHRARRRDLVVSALRTGETALAAQPVENPG
jgi:HEAT repeat protein